MAEVKLNLENDVWLCLDGGTTNTRLWLMRGDEVLDEMRAMVGARQGAAAGVSSVRKALMHMVAGAWQTARATGLQPQVIVGAGMMTSPSGLCDVPHVSGPAGVRDLAAQVQVKDPKTLLAGVATDELPPICLIPGVRFGADVLDAATVGAADVMRGEECTLLGLHADGQMSGGGTLVNLGSHWKRMTLDAAGRVAGSRSTLMGELLHAVSAHTILADALPAQLEPPAGTDVDAAWMDAGAGSAATSGLVRALYEVRLLALRGTATPAQRLAFVLGAAMQADAGLFAASDVAPLFLSGRQSLVNAVGAFLHRRAIPARVLASADIEAAFRRGTRAVVQAHVGMARQPRPR